LKRIVNRFHYHLTLSKIIYLERTRMKRILLIGLGLSFSLSIHAQERLNTAPAVGPSLDDALTGLAAAREAAGDMGVGLTCVVVDSAGDTVAAARMEGVRPFTVSVATGKALMSVTFGTPSGAMAQMAESPFFASLNASMGNRLFPVLGALPIVRNNQVIGAMGCSGATGQQDEDAARVGIDAM
jgi:uncharacterized protein GlcG (DUF336 family)